MAALDAVVERRRHVVTQVVETELRVRAVGDVGVVRLLPEIEGHHVLDRADGHPEAFEDTAVPLGVAFREVVVDGDEVHAGRRESVEIERGRGDERLAFTRLHLGDVTLVEDDPSHHLNVEHPLLRLPPPGLAHCRKGLEEKLLERLTVLESLSELGGLPAQLLVRERLELRLERRDEFRLLLQPLDAPPLAQAKDLLELAEIGSGHGEESVPGGLHALIDSS